jgi:HSP20 family molecular chaperone IbpA
MINYEVTYDDRHVYVTIDVSRFKRYHLIPYSNYIVLYYDTSHTRIDLPVEIIPSSAKITVKNGVLDAVFTRSRGFLPIFKPLL